MAVEAFLQVHSAVKGGALFLDASVSSPKALASSRAAGEKLETLGHAGLRGGFSSQRGPGGG